MRCDDCLHEIPDTADRVAVLKPPGGGPFWLWLHAPGRLSTAVQVFICTACAPFYGEHGIQVSPEDR